jgi:hypothetical protein
MSSLNPLDHTTLSSLGRRGFGGRSRTFRSSSVLAMSHQILQGRESVAGHGLTGGLDQPVVPVFGSGGGLGLGVARWLRQARKHCFDKSIQQRMKCI